MLEKNTEGKKLACVANNSMELTVITDILTDEGIPFLLMEKGTAGYMNIITNHNSVYGTAIYVNEEDIERAKELVDAYFMGHGDQVVE